VKLLIDNALSPVVALRLRQGGHDVVHARDIGMQEAEDEALLLRAEQEDRIIVSADTDFGTLLALRRMPKPSFVLLRRTKGNRPEEITKLLGELLPRVSEDLRKGSIVTVTNDRVRIRALPVLP